MDEGKQLEKIVQTEKSQKGNLFYMSAIANMLITQYE